MAPSHHTKKPSKRLSGSRRKVTVGGDQATNTASAIDYILTLPQDLWDSAPKKPGRLTTSKDRNQELHEATTQELGEAIYQVKGSWVRGLYTEQAPVGRIEEYFRLASSGYEPEKGCWTSLSSDQISESDIRSSLVKIVTNIIDFFDPNPHLGVSRTPVDSHDLLLVHDNGIHASRPPILIKATGPSFEVPEGDQSPEGIGYTNVASVIDARLDCFKYGREEQAEKLAIFCRQIFLQQPNRHFSRCLMITEKHIRLVHYDRSGVYVTPLFDIHKDKELFVRLIVGLTSPDEGVLGLDTTVQWTVDSSTGRKVAGTVTVEEFDDEKEVSVPRTYDLNMNEPPMGRPGIRGRGTTSWHATDPTTNESVLIKDAWRTDTRTSEVEHLRVAAGIPGVIQMLAYQDFCAQTKDYRPPGHKSKAFYNRIKLRVVMKQYGPSIWHFKTRLELLRALRDVLSGHKQLFERGVLHRDISVENILFGAPGAVEGSHGVLIDLDIAVRTENRVSPIPASSRTGTRFYQSISILHAPDMDPPAPQGYLDDLESLFYVLSHLIFLFSGPGAPLRRIPDILQDWLVDADISAGFLKVNFARAPLPVVNAYWGPAFRTLLQEFQAVISDILERFSVIRNDMEMTQDEQTRAYVQVSHDIDIYYDRVELAFDKAIAQVEEEGLRPAELALQEKAPLSELKAQPIAPSTRPLGKKRPSEEGESSTPCKKPRSDILQPNSLTDTREDTTTASDASGSVAAERSGDF